MTFSGAFSTAFQRHAFQLDAFQVGAVNEVDQHIIAGGTPVYPERKRKRRRNRDIDKALDQTFAYLKAREDYRQELDSEPPPRPAPIIAPPLRPDPEQLAALAALQNEIGRLKSRIPDAARAIRQQREEEDIELLLMSL